MLRFRKALLNESVLKQAMFAAPKNWFFSSGTDAIVQECASLHILELRVFLPKNSFLLGNTDILSAAAMFFAKKLVLYGCTRMYIFHQGRFTLFV